MSKVDMIGINQTKKLNPMRVLRSQCSLYSILKILASESFYWCFCGTFCFKESQILAVFKGFL